MDIVSVIVPVYNASKFLDRCIESIVNQIYKNIEVILIDDGSTDDSGSICDRWAKKDQRVKVIHQKNAGVSAARNKGISFATGQYIVQVDSDDYIASNMIETMIHVMKKDDSDLVICDFCQGTEERHLFRQDVELKESKKITPYEALKGIYNSNHDALRYVVPWAKLYRKSLFDKEKYPTGKIFEDIYLTHQLIQKCNQISLVNCELCYYYQVSSSIMNSNFHIKKLDYLDALKNRIFFYDQCKYTDLKEIAYDEYLHSLIWEYSRVRDILKNKEFAKVIHKKFKEVYHKGYASKRYKNETKLFLYAFYINPEIVVFYWKVDAKMKGLIRKE